MKIKKEFIEDIYYRDKEFEIRNSKDKENWYLVIPCVEYKCEPRLFFLEYVESIDISTNDTNQDILDKIDDMFERYNGRTTRDNLDTKTYQWVKENMDYFRKNNWCSIYRWILLPKDTTPKELEAVE